MGNLNLIRHSLKISGAERRVSKNTNKSYMVYKTDLGSMSCFEDELNTKLAVLGFDNKIDVDYTDDGRWKNIKAVHEPTSVEPIANPSEPTPQPQQLQATTSDTMPYKVKIRQNAKRQHNWEVSISANTYEMLYALTDEACRMARMKCKDFDALEGSADVAETLKICPQCRKEIKRMLDICPHCDFDFTGFEVR